MDPISALSVAAAAVQFFQFSLEALRLCKEIRDDVQHATAYNKRLEAATKDVQAALDQLKKEDVGVKSAGSKRINELARQCLTDSEELINLLSKIRGAGKAPSTAKILFRSLKDGKTIEKLQNRLAESQKRLDSAILHDLRFVKLHDSVQNRQGVDLPDRKRLDLASIESRQRFSELSTSVQALVKRLNNSDAVMFKSLEATKTQNDSLQNEIKDVGTTLKSLTVQDNRTRLLDALASPGMLSRREMIAPPYSKTFDWILQDPHPSVDSSLTFAGWLTAGVGPFWLSGKMGSGKSTLMLHIADDRRTRQRLQIWAGSQTLHILSFFFWRPGPAPQRTIAGLLRSLLFQLIQNVPELGDNLDENDELTHGWTIARLGDILGRAFKQCAQHRFCIFVDGLDEFEGEIDELLSVINSLRSYTHVKLCVSSRPEAHLVAAFSDCLRMKLEDLSLPDITSYVFGKLSGFTSTEQPLARYTKRIAETSEGVFLWAALTTQSVARGLLYGDTEDLVWRRIAQTPRGMNALFSQVVNAIDEIHKPSLAFCLRAMQCVKFGILRQEDLITLSAARYEHEISAYSPFFDFCDQIGHQIKAQSQGLLDLYISPINIVEDAWFIPQDTFTQESKSSQASDWTREKLAAANRQIACDDLCQRFAALERTTLMWVHRSAYDFMFDGENELANVILSTYTLNDVADALLKGQMKVLVAAPHAVLEHGANFPTFQNRITELVQTAARVQDVTEDYSIDWLLRDLANVRDIMLPKLPYPGTYPDESGYKSHDVSMLTAMRNDSRVLNFRRGFLWGEILDAGLLEYVEQHLPDILAIEDHGKTVSHLMAVCCSGLEKHDLTCSSVADLLLALLESLEQQVVICSNLGAHQADEVRFRSCLVKFADYAWETVSYSDPHDNDLDIFLHRSVMEHLMSVLTSWVTAIVTEIEVDGRRNFDLSLVPSDCVELLFRILTLLDSLGVFTGSSASKMKYIRPRRLFLQAPAGAHLYAYVQRGLFKLGDSEAALNFQRRRPTFQLACYKKLGALENDTVVAVFHASARLNEMLLPYACCEPGCALEDPSIKSALLREVWDNASGSLSSWQQLFLLACIRTCERPAWARCEGDTHEKDCYSYVIEDD